jgi:hypothetical protein
MNADHYAPTMRVTAATVDLSKSAIRARVVAFAKRWEGTTSESAEKQTFWNELMALFGVDRRQVATFEELAKRASTGNVGWIDFLYPGQMAVEHKSKGSDLDKAMGQLLDYLPALHKSEFPWLLVVSDFDHFVWKNLETGADGEFDLVDFPHNIEIFWWMAGHGKPQEHYENEEAANLKATSLMAALHDGVKATGYDDHALREWLTRIMFCLFADDTDVWERALFHTYLARHTTTDGVNLGPTLSYIFQILDTSPEKRPPGLDDDLSAFSYINGDLFSTTLPIATCDEDLRNALLEACQFDWSVISPAIFGSMFQNVMTAQERRGLGAHYTTEANILRTIRPLFLDNLERELKQATSRPLLQQFHDKLSTLTFLDPACGCGNFLVIAYREIRRLETETLRLLVGAGRSKEKEFEGQRAMGLNFLCKVTVDQFYGIEIDEWPSRIARTALYLVDHIANREVSTEFGEHFVRFPIPKSPHIRIDNALRIDWNTVLDADNANYVFGNPPFIGMSLMDADQDEDNTIVFETPGNEVARSGRLDYVACWYAKSIEYAGKRPILFAYVSTNSLTQGEQARSMAPFLLNHGYAIDFAHRTFAWSSEASGTAHVHVVIVGFSHGGQSRQRTIYDYPDKLGEPVPTVAKNINFYLTNAPDVLIGKHSSPFMPLRVPVEGNRPEDNGGLIVSPEEAEVIEQTDPIAAKYLRPLVGAREMLQGQKRWCFWLVDAEPHDLRSSPVLQERLAIVRTARLKAVNNTDNEVRKRKLRSLANTPSLFTAIRQPKSAWLCIPAHSSSNRRIVPMAMFGPDDIAHNSTLLLADPPLWLFGVLQSAMFTAWVRTVCGRLKSDVRIEADLGYNAFPFPALDTTRCDVTAGAMRAVLDARTAHPTSSLADLYGELSMPTNLVKAHDLLDRAVDAMFAPKKRFTGDADRLATLFERYQELSAPLAARIVGKPKRTRRMTSSS